MTDPDQPPQDPALRAQQLAASLAELEAAHAALRKEKRANEVKYDKDVAVLNQQVSLLQQQVQESQEREGQLKRMNETIFSTFPSDSKNYSREMEMQGQLHEKELEELNARHSAAIDQLQKEVGAPPPSPSRSQTCGRTRSTSSTPSSAPPRTRPTQSPTSRSSSTNSHSIARASSRS